MVSSNSSDALITVDAAYAGDLAVLAADWQRLQADADHSFLQSWGWIGCWLRHLPPEQRIIQVTARRDGDIVGLALRGERRGRRRGLIVSTSAHLSEVGAMPFDSLFVEHNGILANRQCAAGALTTVAGTSGMLGAPLNDAASCANS